jgi:fucose 4-O-acetylase-like acetyltransferase
MLIEDNNYKSKGKRINWIDEAKGIAILLVIIGHTISKYTYGSLIRGIIFSFHMPLFFILSGMTYKGSLSLPQFKTATKKSIRKLLIPALLIFLILTIYSIWLFPEQLSDLGFYKEKIYTLIYASGVNTHFMDNEIPALGKLWFLFALVIARTLFDYCHLYFSEMQLALVCSIFSALGIILGQIQCLPFSMDIAFAVLPFLYIGYKMKNLKNLNIVGVKIFFITLVIWGITLMLTFPNLSNWTYLELAIRRYPLYCPAAH